MHRLFKRLFVLSLIAGPALSLYGQKQQDLPFLKYAADTRAAGMGYIVLSDSYGAALYANPSSIFAHDNKLNVSYSVGINPKEMYGGTQMIHTASLGYEIGTHHALFAGIRYWQSSPIDIMDNNSSDIGRITSKDRSVDLGYTALLFPQLSISATISYINSYNSLTSHIFLGSLGISYDQRKVSSLNNGAWGLSLSLNGIGPKYHYGTQSAKAQNLPLCVRMAGNLSMGLWEGHKFTVGSTAQLYTGKSHSQKLILGIGAEYNIERIMALRLGASLETHKSFVTVGIGRQFGIIDINLAYKLGQISEFNTLSMGLSLNI